MDVTDFAAWSKLKDFVIGKYGYIDALINNAGSGVAIKDTDILTKDEIDTTIMLNLNSAIYSANVFAPRIQGTEVGYYCQYFFCMCYSLLGWLVSLCGSKGRRFELLKGTLR